MVQISISRGLPLGHLSIAIPKASIIRLKSSSDFIGCHGRTASYLTAPAQIPACGATALGSSEILASVKDKLVLPSLLFPAGRFASVILSFHRVDLLYVKELIGSPKFFISLYRHAMCQDPDRPSLESRHIRFFCVGFRY